MNKKIHLTSLAISGAGALLVGLTGEVQATTIPVRVNTHAAPPANPAFSPQTHAGPATLTPPTLVLPVSVQAPSAAAARNSRAPLVRPGRTVLTVPVATVAYVPSPINVPGLVGSLVTPVPVAPSPVPAASVPDGGSTGVMLGGVFGGLALMRKKFKV